MLCLKCSIVNPVFNSQSKEELNTPISKFGFECNIPDSFYTEVKSSGIIDRLKDVLTQSNIKLITRLESNKTNRIKNIPKLDDANFAGTKKSNMCTLILTEGDSAKATAISGISAIPNGRNLYGVYPLRGKLLNVREASTAQITNNNEIIELKKILALKSGTVYDSMNINELRYSSVMIMTDADEDGSHIKGLILNFFDYFFPSLLMIPDFIKILVTPLVKATNNITHETFSFSNLRAYNVWKEKQDNIDIYKIKYYKGLGTSTSKEAGEYFTNIDNNTITIKTNITNNDDIMLAFAKDKVNDRKMWLMNYDPTKNLELVPPQVITIKQFVHMELIHFSNYDNIRSIPSICDGFKPSQRKVIHTFLKKNITNETKIAQVAAIIAADTAYHHGEQSLVMTVINMAQNFVGANNLNLLVPAGQLGTRLMGGKDHSSARYIYTCLEKYVPYIFRKEDTALLEFMEDDGITIEPQFFLPIVPMILVNGTEGIGTGFSTSIPCYNIRDIISYLIARLKGTKIPSLIPYYMNHTGNVTKYDDMTYVSSGIITFSEKLNEITITELPIKMWTNDMKDILEELVYNKTNTVSLFKSYMNMSSDTTINFILKYNDDMKEKIISMYKDVDSFGLNSLYKYLRLYKTIKISNMNLYNTNYKIQQFKSPEEIIDSFYVWRLEFFELRKANILKKLKDMIKLYSNMIQFIMLVKNNKKIFNMNPEDMIKYMKENKLEMINGSYNYLTDMSFMHLTQTNMEKLENKMKDLRKEYKIVEEKTKKDMWLEDLEELNNFLQ